MKPLETVWPGSKRIGLQSPVMTQEDDSIIDEEEEVFEEIIEETVGQSVELVIEQMISFVIEQDPEVMCQGSGDSWYCSVLNWIEK